MWVGPEAASPEGASWLWLPPAQNELQAAGQGITNAKQALQEKVPPPASTQSPPIDGANAGTLACLCDISAQGL